MARYAQPPPELAQAISRAAARYRIPNGVAVLTGIWQRESGSTFPNPAVNSEGYGGLFGTTNWNGSTQAQADLAASILAAQLREHGGDLSAALRAYSGGGYSSVAGVASSGAPDAPAPASSTGFSRPRPGQGQASSALAAWYDYVPTPLGSVGSLSGSIGSLDGVWNGIAKTVTGGWDVLKLFLWLAKPLTWLRVFEALLGVLLMGLSVRALAYLLMEREARGFLRSITGSSRRSTSARRSASRRPPDELAAARARTEAERTKEVRARRRRALEESRDRRRQREERERRAFWEGVRNAGGS